MDSTMTADTPAAAGMTDVENTIAGTLEQIQTIREQMRLDDDEIARLKAENALLKAESQTLRDETRAILASLQRAA